MSFGKVQGAWHGLIGQIGLIGLVPRKMPECQPGERGVAERKRRTSKRTNRYEDRETGGSMEFSENSM